MLHVHVSCMCELYTRVTFVQCAYIFTCVHVSGAHIWACVCVLSLPLLLPFRDQSSQGVRLLAPLGEGMGGNANQ